ncbi:hypothetical protein ACWF0M_13980 [Kribbella sp. NPDC055110]
MSELRGRRDRGDDADADDTARTDERAAGADSAAESPGPSDPREKLNRHLDELYWPGYSAQPSVDERDTPSASADTQHEAHDADPQQEDPFASYSPDLQAHFRHDDTLARLQYESPNPETTASNPQPHAADDHEAPAPWQASEQADQPNPAQHQQAHTPDHTTDPADPGESGEGSGDEPGSQPGDSVGDGASGSGIGAETAQADDPTTTVVARTEDVADADTGTNPSDADRSEPAESRYAELVAERDKDWDPAEAALPPGALPESTKTLTQEVVDALHPDVRRVLEYQGAAEYITANKDERPWLEPASDASPQVQRILTAVDQGTGHAHIRHGPMGNDQLYADRVARLEDPAQTDPDKRAKSIDGLDETKQHYCAKESTRIHDPEAFVAAFAAAVKHPDVHQVLNGPWTSGGAPNQVPIPITDLLGPDGHESCSGYRLVGDWSEVKKARKEWVKARAEGRDLTDLPEPQAERIPTFEGGHIIVSFTINTAAQRYEINTLFPVPPKQQPTAL